MQTIIFKYGVKLDRESINLVSEQINKSRWLYNEIIAYIRDCRKKANDFLIDSSPFLAERIDELKQLNEQFKIAKAINDEEAMKSVREQEIAIKKQLSPLWKDARLTHKQALGAFFQGIGRSKENETYQMRCKAVETGLGSDVADHTLDTALKTWDTVRKDGGELSFRNAKLRTNDSLINRFKVAGGLSVKDFLDSDKEHGVFSVKLPAKADDRQYGEFKFRVGHAKHGHYATGTFEYARELPPNANITAIKLVRKRVADKYNYYLQFQLAIEEYKTIAVNDKARKPFVALHLGFHTLENGRIRIAGIANHIDAYYASFLDMPRDYYHDLWRVENMQASRDKHRDNVHDALRQSSIEGDEQLAGLLKLPAQHVAPEALSRAVKDIDPGYFVYDLKKRRELAFLRTRVLNRRDEFYKEFAKQLCRKYRIIAISKYELDDMALRIKSNGERNELGAKERSQRYSVALYSLIQHIKWAAARCDVETTVIEHDDMKYARVCSCCGTPFERESNWLDCEECGLSVDIKANNSASLYKELVNKAGGMANEINSALLAKQQTALSRKIAKIKAMQDKRNKKAA